MRWKLKFIGILLACGVRQELVAQTPGFEVAAIHRSTQPANVPIQDFSVVEISVRISNYSVTQLISLAYGIPAAQVLGPEWINSERFDLWAKMPPEATKQDALPSLRSLMMKSFALRTHKETS